MHTLLLIGLLGAAAVGSVGLAAFFIGAWRSRRADSEYLLFGLMTLCLAANSGLMAGAYFAAVAPEAGLPLRLMLDLLVVTSKIAIPLLLHYSLRYAGVRGERRIVLPVYGLSAVFVIMVAADAWWQHLPATFSTRQVLGLDVHQLPVSITTPAYLFYVMMAAIALATVYLHGRTYFRGRREGLTAFIGSIILVATMANDAALSTGLYPTIPLVSLGFFALAIGAGVTLVARLGTLSAALERRTGELHQRSEELTRSYEQLEATQKELVKTEQLAVVGELAAVIAHEVRNPLAIVGNAVASLRKGATQAGDRAALLAIIEDEMTRLEALVGRLLNYARPVVPERRPVDLGSLLERCLAVVDDQPGINRSLEIEAGTPNLSGDAHLLRQAFENVITNAVQAMGQEGVLEIRVRRGLVGHIPVVEVAVRDSGEGMTEETAGQALAPFFTTRPTGTGLGLPIVQRIAEAHGGRVTIEGVPGAGTTVTLVLPEEEEHRLSSMRPQAGRTSLLP